MLFQKKNRINENEGYYNSVHPGTISIPCKQWINNQVDFFYGWACSADLWGQNREK